MDFDCKPPVRHITGRTTKRMTPITLLLCCLIVVSLSATLGAEARPPASPAPAYRVPRNGFGQPDFEGAWTNATITPQARPARFGARLIMTQEEVAEAERKAQAEIERGNQPTDPNTPAIKDGSVGGYNRAFIDPGTQIMRVRGEPRTSLITTPDGLPPKPKPGANIAQAEIQAAATTAFYRLDEFGSVAGATEGEGAKDHYDGPEDLSLGERCLTSFGRNGPPPMFSNGFYNNNYQIAQNRDEVLLIVEMVHDQRHIKLNTKAHPPANVRPWFGDSIGRFEEDTLVVETTNIPQIQAYFGSWEHLKVTERFTRVADNRVRYQFTVEDPTVWDQPWGGEYEFAALSGRLYEYACHEGNYAAPGILAGSRATDRSRVAK